MGLAGSGGGLTCAEREQMINKPVNTEITTVKCRHELEVSVAKCVEVGSSARCTCAKVHA